MVTSRRDFLQAAAILSAATLPTLGAAVEAGRGAPAFARVVYDARQPAAEAFGRDLAARGAATVAVVGEVHDLWHDDLRLQWQRAGAPVVGMTDFRALQLLQMMAAESRRRLVLRIHHHLPGARHEIYASQAHQLELGTRYRRDADWTAVTARYLSETPAGQFLSREGSNLHRAHTRALTREALVTWMIA